MKIIAVVIVLLLAVTALGADSLLKEAGDAVVETVEISLVGGSVGLGMGLYWPVYDVPKIGVTVGPFVVFGNQLIGVGGGVTFPLQIPYLENWIDFGGVGGALKHQDLTLEYWVGKTIPIR